jgi:hypothetical protein
MLNSLIAKKSIKTDGINLSQVGIEKTPISLRSWAWLKVLIEQGKYVSVKFNSRPQWGPQSSDMFD